jgi:hypothetical protein
VTELISFPRCASFLSTWNEKENHLIFYVSLKKKACCGEAKVSVELSEIGLDGAMRA